MTIHSEWIHYGDKGYLGYVAMPDRAQKPLPAIVVIQEIWGVDEHIQDITRRFAQAGYCAFAPDLYAVNGSRPDGLEPARVEAVKRFLESLPPTAWHSADDRDVALSRLPEPEKTHVGETFARLFGGLNMSLYTEQMTATTAFVRDEFAATKGQSVGTVGFCMGGALSALTASLDEQLQAAVIFYGNAPSTEQLSNIQCPVLGFYGQLDTRISEAVPGFAEQMKQAGKTFDFHIYDEAHHAFFNDSRSAYNVKAARDAFARTLTFFNKKLV